MCCRLGTALRNSSVLKTGYSPEDSGVLKTGYSPEEQQCVGEDWGQP